MQRKKKIPFSQLAYKHVPVIVITTQPKMEDVYTTLNWKPSNQVHFNYLSKIDNVVNNKVFHDIQLDKAKHMGSIPFHLPSVHVNTLPNSESLRQVHWARICLPCRA